MIDCPVDDILLSVLVVSDESGKASDNDHTLWYNNTGHVAFLIRIYSVRALLLINIAATASLRGAKKCSS